MRLCLDACVLYPTVLREILSGVAAAGLFEPLWSARLLEEWRRTAARRSAGDAVIAEAEITRLTLRWPNAIVPPDPAFEARLWLPDPADIHVLATAIQGKAEGIVTLNLRDFPRQELAPFGLTAHHPDALLFRFWQQDPDPISTAVKAVHATAEALAGTPLDPRDLLKRARLPRLGKALSPSW